MQDDDNRESTATATWSRMLAGNRRFAEGTAEHPWQDRETRESLLDRQTPDAAVLACSDSRVPPEIIFDAGLGDLFTIRNAGQVIDDATLGSLEYAVTKLHVSLIVVLGHESCGAISMAADAVDMMSGNLIHKADDAMTVENNIDNLAERIMEMDSVIIRQAGISVWQAREAELENTDDYERVHIAHTIEELVTRSDIVQDALANNQLMIVGARYQMKSGIVEVLSF